MSQNQTPVVLLVYNRPELTRQVLDALVLADRRSIMVVADGPASEADEARCGAVRAHFEQLGPEWTVERRFSDDHLGCGRNVWKGIDWVFSQVDRAIILEDDTVPDPSFFRFCSELLDRFADQEEVMQISGTNLAGSVDSEASYAFSRFSLPPWGWATWADRWKKYDFYMREWDNNRQKLSERLGPHFDFWQRAVEAYRPAPYSWDFQWNTSILMHDGLSVVPSRNLVSNIGWGVGATHTRISDTVFSEMERFQCDWPLVHPPDLTSTYDDLTEPLLYHLFSEANRA